MKRISSPRYLFPGLYGGIVAIAAEIILRTLVGTRLLAEVIVDASTQGLQPRGFSALLETFGSSGKPLLFLSVLVLEVLAYVLAWQMAEKLVKTGSTLSIAIVAAGFAAVARLTATVLMVTLTVANLGSNTSWLEYGLALIVCSAAFAVAALAFAATTTEVRFSQSRRSMLQLIPVMMVGLAAIVLAGRQVLRATGGGVQASNPPGEPTPEITETDKFYVVSKNIIDPVVDARKWRLKVGGASRQMVELTYEDILAMPAQDEYATLQCISNEVNGDLIGNALWRGFPLRDLIDRVQPLTSARYVMFRSEDDYTESLPLDFARGDGVMLVHSMNGAPLSDKHGFPLRLLAPGKYGVKHPKWITEIALIDAEFFGYWQKRDWDQEARMHTSTRIDVPEQSEVINDLTTPYRIHGIAFAGNRGIARVEVTTDAGATWHDATLKPALSPFTWVLWYYDWTDLAANSGQRVVIQARATDGTGDVQTSASAPPYPAGATGYPRISVRLSNGS